jgi:hypothetical protein
MSMTDPRTDQIAREAARLIEIGRTDDIDSAIRIAADALGLRGAPHPGQGRVRKHAQAMAMQALGEQAYSETRLNIWRIAEQIMSVFDHVMPDATAMLVGRAAQGFFDAGVTIHLRLYTRQDIGELARILVEYGYDEPQFETAETWHGRLSQLRLKEGEYEIVVTRCLPELHAQSKVDLFTGNSIETLSLPALRRRLDEAE